jgi:hypothetical protein
MNAMLTTQIRENINRIDYLLKESFTSVKLSSRKEKFDDLYVFEVTGIKENYKFKEYKVILEFNANVLDSNRAVIEWDYYTDPSKPSYKITRQSSIDKISESVSNIVLSKMYDTLYLEQMTAVDDTLYEIKDDTMFIDKNKLSDYLENLGVHLADINLEDNSPKNNVKKFGFLDKDVRYNLHVSLTVNKYNESISPETQMTIESNLTKKFSPYTDNVFMDLKSSSINLTFSLDSSTPISKIQLV